MAYTRRTRRTRMNDRDGRIAVRDTESPASRHVSVLRNTIKDMLRNVRAQSGLSQTVVATKLGVKPGNISRLESGYQTPSLITIDAFFRACGFELNITAERIGNARTGGSNSQSTTSPTPPI